MDPLTLCGEAIAGARMHVLARYAPTLLVPLSVALMLNGISAVDGAELFIAPREMACANQDAYYLPKSLIEIKGKTNDAGKVAAIAVSVHVAPDQQHHYCLDLAPPFAENGPIFVSKTENGLLRQISSVAQNRAPQTRAAPAEVFFGDSKSDSELKTLNIVFDIEFDPFDEHESALADASLKKFGLCVLLREAPWAQSVDVKSVNAYCQNPPAHTKRNSASRQQANEGHITSGRGLFYRPRLPYTLMLFAKKEQRSLRSKNDEHARPKKWLLQHRQTVLLENMAPIIAVGVNRSLLAMRQATLKFEQGQLASIDIKKKNGLDSFVEIPLAIAQRIVSPPGAVVLLRINSDKNQTRITEAEKKLLQIQNSLRSSPGKFR